MATASCPSTPSRAQEGSATPAGKWRHPQFDEIYRRQNRTTFSDRNMKKVLYNIGGIIVVWITGYVLWSTFPTAFETLFQPYASWAYCIIMLVFGINILTACRPLCLAKDDLSDIPLTPAQRKLLGLAPSATPPPPDAKYSTPPRYTRTPTPMSASPVSRGSFNNSPLSGKGSPANVDLSGSPFSPGASPLLQKIGGNGLTGPRRSSYGSPSPLGPGGRGLNVAEPGTPSPSTKNTKLGLNNKWLYDQARRNSGGAKIYI